MSNAGYTLNPQNGSHGNFDRPTDINVHTMIIGVGLDMIEVTRIQQSITQYGDRFTHRIFTPDERTYCQAKSHPAMHYAARFAAKEACAKALGTGIARGIRFTDIEITRTPSGQPTILLTNNARTIAGHLAVQTIHLSLTHTNDHAAAVVILETDPAL